MKKISIVDRLKILFTGKLSSIVNLEKIEPTNETRLWAVWFNPEDRYFEVFDKHNKIVTALKDVTISDEWSKFQGKKNRPLTVTMSINAVFVSERPKENEVIEINTTDLRTVLKRASNPIERNT